MCPLFPSRTGHFVTRSFLVALGLARMNSDFWDEHVENRGGVEVVVESPSSVQGRLQRLEQRQRAQSQGAVRRRPSPARGYSWGLRFAMVPPTLSWTIYWRNYGTDDDP